jgi:hypothetical protein
MTPEEHNKFLGIANLAYGGFHLLMMFVMLVFISVMFTAIANDPHGSPPPPGFFLPFILIAGLFQTIFSIPPFIAGYALLKRKRWAKIAAIVSGVMSAMSVPVGTAVSVYTFWFLFSEPGKVLYDGVAPRLPPPPPTNWADVRSREERPYEYVGGGAPPDWR